MTKPTVMMMVSAGEEMTAKKIKGLEIMLNLDAGDIDAAYGFALVDVPHEGSKLWRYAFMLSLDALPKLSSKKILLTNGWTVTGPYSNPNVG